MKLFQTVILASFLMIGSMAKAKQSVGLIASTPELFGLAGSFYPMENISLDGWMTLNTLDGGLTAHLPFTESGHHNLVLTGMVGYSHNLVKTSIMPSHGFHTVAALGYGWQKEWDIRLQMGLALNPFAGGALPCFHSNVSVSRMF